MAARDTDNSKVKRQLQIKKAAKILRKHGFKTAFVLALGGGGGFVNHHYINADAHFLEAMQAQDTDDMRHYADNLVIKNDVNTVIEHIVREGNSEALDIVFEAADDRHSGVIGGVWERLFNDAVAHNIDSYITAAVDSGHYDFLADFADEAHQFLEAEDIFIRLLNENAVEEAAAYLESQNGIQMRHMIELLPNLKERVANQHVLNNFFTNHLDSVTLDYPSGGAILYFPADNSAEAMAERRAVFLGALLDHGYEEAASSIIEKYPEDTLMQARYLEHFAVQGDFDQLLAVTYDSNVSTDRELIDIAINTALAGYYDIAGQFVEHFALDRLDYLTRSFVRAFHADDKNLARYALREFIERGYEREATVALEIRVESYTHLAFDLVQEYGHLFDPQHHGTLINMFEGVMDDNLRRLFEEGNRASPAAEEQAPRLVTRPNVNIP